MHFKWNFDNLKFAHDNKYNPNRYMQNDGYDHMNFNSTKISFNIHTSDIYHSY